MNMHERALIDLQASGALAQTPVASTVDFLRVVRRHYRKVIATVAIVMGIAIAALIFIPARYDATAVMQVDTDEIDLPDPQGASVRDAELRRQHQIDTQVQLLSSRSVARQTVRDLALADDPEFNPAASDGKKPATTGFLGWLGSVFDRQAAQPGPTPGKGVPISPQVIERTTDRLLDKSKVAQDGESSFVNVIVTSTSAAKAARIANKITANYTATQVNERRRALSRAVTGLEGRVGELRSQLVSTETAMATYRRTHRLDPGTGQAADTASAGRLASELAATRGIMAEAQARSRRGQLQATSPLLADLRGQETTTQRRLAELSTIYGGAHPDVQKANAELGEIRRNIEAETTRISQQLATEAVAQQAHEAQLASDLGAVKSQSLAQGISAVPLADMERNADSMRSIYVALLGRLTDLQRQEETVKADATIASPALRPTSPSFPRTGQVLGAAIGASVIFGLLVVVLSEALDTQIRTSNQVFELTGLPTLGMVPEVSRHRRDVPAHMTVIEKPYSMFAEAVRAIEARLERQLPNRSGNVILVTSPLPADGKTTLSIGLTAAAIATLRSAVVVDFDLRRPGLPSLLDGSEGHDLIDYLNGVATLDEVILANPAFPQVKAIQVRKSARDPGAVLASPKLDVLFEELRGRFDTIIVNTPPVLAVGDVQSLARHADAVILLLRWGKTTADLLRSAVSQFDGEITGVVFNRVRYAKHARLVYGDPVQHYQKAGAYYWQDSPRPLMPRWIRDRMSA